MGTGLGMVERVLCPVEGNSVFDTVQATNELQPGSARTRTLRALQQVAANNTHPKGFTTLQ